ncbi:MAG TPA: DmsC/YnfH family molybdoenzyme membrane anchor subunit [Dokdonella sp.]|uniref:dimethyl sulfoxide reductase anchor subunit family protein n=1 Tax=Dokdonella sp. TaxID=2291710 RepID=UPI002D7E2CF3|nr:DmsC/YnfH family molybdoenzyme membrane anchor subunit [Dokdonella sp.]HET9034386.1 DmsC/YnfH family molybdoenzyme membrane anchor subunit [Dokdonella sp.]
MRPSFSIIFFTVLSGAGYGLWMLVGLTFALQWPNCVPDGNLSGVDRETVLCIVPDAITYAFGAGWLLVVSGLVASVGHLGKPLRAWRAFSQWRSSWLSREGISALLTFLPAVAMVLYAMLVSLQLSQVDVGDSFTPWIDRRVIRLLGAVLAFGSLATVYCTANIYASLKPISGWNNRFVMPIYLVLAIHGGLLLLWLLNTLPSAWVTMGEPLEARWNLVIGLGVLLFSVLGAALKLIYWKQIDRKQTTTTADAIGLASLDNVRSFEQPHTEENYLTHEMGFRIARKHSRKLRMICLSAGFAVPAILATLSLVIPGLGVAAAWVSVFSGMLGIFIERWLFFAEAKHAVMLYYGARDA